MSITQTPSAEQPVVHRKKKAFTVKHGRPETIRVSEIKSKQPKMKLSDSWDLLEESWPKAFDHKDPKPLKIGILADLVNTKKETTRLADLKRSLSRYCNSIEYQRALMNSEHRIDIDGLPAGEIIKTHKVFACKKMKSIIEKIKKCKAERKKKKKAEKPKKAPKNNLKNAKKSA